MKHRAEVIDFMKLAMTLSEEQQQFITEVLTLCNDKDIRPDDAWNTACRGYGIPTTQELDNIRRKQHDEIIAAQPS